MKYKTKHNKSALCALCFYVIYSFCVMPIFAEAKTESKEKQEKKGLFGFIKRDKSKTQQVNSTKKIDTSKKEEKRAATFLKKDVAAF